MGEMDKSQDLYSREENNSSQFEGKTVAWEHTICGKNAIASTERQMDNVTT